MGNQSPICALLEYGTASGLVLFKFKTDTQFTFLIVPKWGAKQRLFLKWHLVGLEPMDSRPTVKGFNF